MNSKYFMKDASMNAYEHMFEDSFPREQFEESLKELQNAVPKSASWARMKKHAVLGLVNCGLAWEVAFRFIFTKRFERLHPEDCADCVIRNKSGAVAATVEVKSGAFNLTDNGGSIESFERFAHATHVCFIPRYDGYLNIEEARVVPRAAMLKALKEFKCLRDDKPRGSTRGGGVKLALKPIFPTPSTNGLSFGQRFLEWFYENGESLQDFYTRIDADGLW